MRCLRRSTGRSRWRPRTGRVPVLDLEGVEVQHSDCPVGVVAVEAFDGDFVALGLIGVVPVAVCHQLGAGRLDLLGEQAPRLRGGLLVGLPAWSGRRGHQITRCHCARFSIGPILIRRLRVAAAARAIHGSAIGHCPSTGLRTWSQTNTPSSPASSAASAMSPNATRSANAPNNGIVNPCRTTPRP